MNDLNDALRREILALRTSTSWRITAPLRQLSTILRKNKALGSKADITRHQLVSLSAQARSVSPPEVQIRAAAPTPQVEVVANSAPTDNLVSIALESPLGEVLALDGEDFVRTSHRIAHKREPFENELQWGLDRLMLGDAKIGLLYRLTQSPEGKAQKVRVRGLARSYYGYRAAQLPILGVLISLFKSFERDDLLSRRVRAVEQRLAVPKPSPEPPAIVVHAIAPTPAPIMDRIPDHEPVKVSSIPMEASEIAGLAVGESWNLDSLSHGWPIGGRVNV